MGGKCGWGKLFRPRCLQRFATPKWFLVVYMLMAGSKNGFDKYFHQTLTTMEKRFKLPSQMIGIIVSGNEVSMLLICLVFAHYGGKGNRPLWIACGYAASALSSMLLALPHLLYGPGEDALSLTEEYLDAQLLNDTTGFADPATGLCFPNKSVEVCEENHTNADKEFSMTVVAIMLLAHVVYGIGTSVYYTLLQTYMDDNAKKTESLVLFNIGSLGHAMSPLVYSTLASYCLKLYIDPFLTPVITNKDPRWMGAWWLGWLIMAAFDFFICVLVSLFPKKMKAKRKKHSDIPLVVMRVEKEEIEYTVEPRESHRKNDILHKKHSKRNNAAAKGFFASLRRVLTNKLLLFCTTSTLITGFVNVGKDTFIMKYAEVQYEITPSEVAMSIGAARTPVRIFGTLLTAIFYVKFKPNAKFILGWSFVERCVKIATFVLILQNACSISAFKGTDTIQGRSSLADNCSVDCSCDNVKYEPMCSIVENVTYFSPCYAGCTEVSVHNHRKHYSNCSCVPSSNDGYMNLLEPGPCHVDCSYQLTMFMVAHYAYEFIQRTSAVGRKFFSLRCVETIDKSVAQAVILIFSSIFAFLPAPIIMGYLIDHSCLLWDKTCNLEGNCWVYNKNQFRIWFFGALTAISILGALSDIIVWHLGRHTDFYKEDEDKKFFKKNSH